MCFHICATGDHFREQQMESWTPLRWFISAQMTFIHCMMFVQKLIMWIGLFNQNQH